MLDDRMPHVTNIVELAPRRTPIRIAMTVMRIGHEWAICPFFGKCDGVLVLEPGQTSPEFHRNERRTPPSLCDLIIATRPQGLVCGYVGEPEKDKLREAGIDVRLGSCLDSLDQIVACFCDLPHA